MTRVQRSAALLLLGFALGKFISWWWVHWMEGPASDHDVLIVLAVVIGACLVSGIHTWIVFRREKRRE